MIEYNLEDKLVERIHKIQLQACESQTIELKTAINGCPRIYDTLSSFSNQNEGGTIIFGINEEENYKIVGVSDAQQIQKRIVEQCQEMEPVVRAKMTVVQVDGKTVVAAEIPPINLVDRPCYYKSQGLFNGSYIRVGDSDRKMTGYEIYSYVAFRQRIEDEVRTNENATMMDIDKTKLNECLDSLKEERPKFAKLENDKILQLQKLEKDGHPTLLCTLLFAYDPQVYYPNYSVVATVVPGTERGAISAGGERFEDNQRIEGTIPEILKESLNFALKNMKIQTVIAPQTGKRKDRTEYPLMAIREAILNALIHRDYSIYTENIPIEMTFFHNRLEIRNPGGLYGFQTIEMLGKEQPDTRNPKLVRLLELLKFTENRGSGIPTIQREMHEAGLKEALFQDSRKEFRVTFFNERIRSAPEVNPEQKLLLDFCKKPKSRQEIANFLHISTVPYVARNIIKPLVEQGLLQLTIPHAPQSKNQRYYYVEK